MKNLVKTKVKIIIDKANIYVWAVQLFTNCKAFTISSKKNIYIYIVRHLLVIKKTN